MIHVTDEIHTRFTIYNSVENNPKMGSSISHPNLKTASAVRVETVTGAHFFKVSGYSLTKGIGVGKYINSDVFTIGGYKWMVKYYPDGISKESSSCLCFLLEIQSEYSTVNAQFNFAILQSNGVAAATIDYETSTVYTFLRESGAGTGYNRLRSESGAGTGYNRLRSESGADTGYNQLRSENGAGSTGYSRLIKRAEFETSGCLKNDAFTIKCTVTVVKGTKLEATSPYGVVVPPPNLNHNMTDLLASGRGADVAFVVKGERFNAHRCVLATRSAVFNAMFFGGMKEKRRVDIEVNDIEVSVFKSMLYYIYSDSVPDFATTSDDQNMSLNAQHLLVAADRYGLERLRIMCEDILCQNLDVGTVTTALILAEKHNCDQLKAECLKFMSSTEVFKAVTLTPEFSDLMKICPSIVMDFKALYLK